MLTHVSLCSLMKAANVSRRQPTHNCERADTGQYWLEDMNWLTLTGGLSACLVGTGVNT